MISSWPGPDPAIHVFHGRQAWITGSSPVMTTLRVSGEWGQGEGGKNENPLIEAGP